MMMGSTTASGGKPMKLAPRLVVNHVRPSAVKKPLIVVASSAPGTCTVTPDHAMALVATAVIANRSTKSVKGSGSLLPIRSIPPRRRSTVPGRAVVAGAVDMGQAFRQSKKRGTSTAPPWLSNSWATARRRRASHR